ncbi:hypothetical protein DMENIID0001_064800 [Sergentomyia squamirostris]
MSHFTPFYLFIAGGSDVPPVVHLVRDSDLAGGHAPPPANSWWYRSTLPLDPSAGGTGYVAAMEPPMDLPAFWSNTAGGYGNIAGSLVAAPNPSAMDVTPLSIEESYMDREIVPPPSSAAYPRRVGEFEPPPSPVYIAGDTPANVPYTGGWYDSPTSPVYIAGESPAITSSAASTIEEEDELIIISDDDDSCPSSSSLSQYYSGSEPSIVSLDLGGNIRDRVVNIEGHYHHCEDSEETWSIGAERGSTSDLSWDLNYEEAIEIVEADERVEQEKMDDEEEEASMYEMEEEELEEDDLVEEDLDEEEEVMNEMEEEEMEEEELEEDELEEDELEEEELILIYDSDSGK